jgi:hypothetical protein
MSEAGTLNDNEVAVPATTVSGIAAPHAEAETALFASPP